MPLVRVSNGGSPSTLTLSQGAKSGHTMSLSQYSNGDVLIVLWDGYGWGSGTLFNGGVTQIAVSPAIAVNWTAYFGIVQVTDKTTAMNVVCTHGYGYACKIE